LKEFKDLRLVFSVDGYGKCNEYMRFPSSWEVVSKNIKRFKTLQNAYVYMNCVVQNLNVLYVDDLLKFANQNDIFIKLDLVLNPNWLHLSVLPKNILTMAHRKLSSIKKEDLHHTDSVDQIINMLETNINNYNLDTVKYNNFIDMVKKRDNYRKIDIKNYLPELADEILK
jgi:glutamate-1-semialdehyde 2,1-aminomutase